MSVIKHFLNCWSYFCLSRKQLLKVKGQKRAQLFEKLARQISTDPSVQDNGGELGWIAPFRYVYSFEEAVYGTKVGEVTPIFRTAYGFHIALVEEEKRTKKCMQRIS